MKRSRVIPGLVLLVMSAVVGQAAAASNASTDSSRRVATTVGQTDTHLVQACGTGDVPASFARCLAAVTAEQRALAPVAADVRAIVASPSSDATQAGLKAGLDQGFKDLTAALAELRSALQVKSRLNSSTATVRTAIGEVVGYALALAPAASTTKEPTHHRIAWSLGVGLPLIAFGVLGIQFGLRRRT